MRMRRLAVRVSARARTETYADKKPLQFIAGVALAGFAIGFLLRMGRDE